MATIRKRTWVNTEGEQKSAFLVDYLAREADGSRRRRTKQFEFRRDAEAFRIRVDSDLQVGKVVPSRKQTVDDTVGNWIKGREAAKRERSTIDQYNQHRKHIRAVIGHVKLIDLTAQHVEKLRDDLLQDASPAMARKVLVSLRSAIRSARLGHNVAADVKVETDKRGRKKLKAGVDFPTTAEVAAIIGATSGKSRALLMVAAFAGLRASEIRGLRWRDIDLKNDTITVEQRADRYAAIGNPKSKDSHRTVPVGPRVVAALREWKVECPKNSGDLAFPTSEGNVDHHKNVTAYILHPSEIRARVAVQIGRDSEGRPIFAPKYTGLHMLRHFYASWCLARPPAGIGLTLKETSERLGHASIVLTADTYGHLLPDANDAKALADAETRILG